MMLTICVHHLGKLFPELALAEQFDLNDEVVPIMVEVFRDNACTCRSTVALKAPRLAITKE